VKAAYQPKIAGSAQTAKPNWYKTLSLSIT
jgi:hypothetical protein